MGGGEFVEGGNVKRQLAKLTSLVSGVVDIKQIDRMVYVTFGDGSVAICEPKQADIDAAVNMLEAKTNEHERTTKELDASSTVGTSTAFT